MSFRRIPMYAYTSCARFVYARRIEFLRAYTKRAEMKNTVHNDATSSILKGKPMTKTIV